jgi:nucleoside 2-deoxyribosyltransferase
VTIKRSFNNFGISAERADDIEHSGKITEEIINKIRTSEFLYADLTGARPNVYYEVGFAHALSKKVILYRKSGESLHFDLAGYNCPEYKNLVDLEKKLISRLESMTGRKIKKRK